MDFWDTFWATVWGALGGALVGATASWLFALDLRRREHEHAYADRLDAAVARVVHSINDVAGTPLSPADARRRRRANYAHDVEHMLFAVMSAEIVANSNDARVLRALETRIIEWGQLRDGDRIVFDDSPVFVRSALNTVRDLTRWRRGEIDAHETWRRLHRDTSPVVPARPNPRRRRDLPPE